MTDLDHIDDLAALYVLGALDAPELAEAEAHLARCPRCRHIVAETRETQTLLAYATPVLAPPAHVRASLLRQVRAEQRDQRRAVGRARGGWTPLWSSSVAVAACLSAVVVLAGLSVTMGYQAQMKENQLRQLVPSATQEAGAVATLIAPHAATVPLTGTGNYAAATGRLFLDYQRQRGVLMVRQLPVLPAGMSYQVWLAHARGARWAGAFQVDADGLATVELNLALDPDAGRSVLVTMASDNGDDEQAGQPVLAAAP